MDTTVHPELINTRFAYVSVSRASQDARIYTNDAGNLGERLSTDVTKTSAIDLQKASVEPTANQQTKESPMTNTREHPQDDLRREPPTEAMVSIPEIICHEAEVDPRHYAPHRSSSVQGDRRVRVEAGDGRHRELQARSDWWVAAH